MTATSKETAIANELAAIREDLGQLTVNVASLTQNVSSLAESQRDSRMRLDVVERQQSRPNTMSVTQMLFYGGLITIMMTLVGGAMSITAIGFLWTHNRITELTSASEERGHRNAESASKNADKIEASVVKEIDRNGGIEIKAAYLQGQWDFFKEFLLPRLKF